MIAAYHHMRLRDYICLIKNQVTTWFLLTGNFPLL